jgi:hypothetical protein
MHDKTNTLYSLHLCSVKNLQAKLFEGGGIPMPGVKSPTSTSVGEDSKKGSFLANFELMIVLPIHTSQIAL